MGGHTSARRRARRNMAVAFVVVLCGVAAVAGVRAAPAAACAWNIGCEFYSPTEGHTAAQFGPSASEGVGASWDTYSSFLAIATTTGGTWRDSATVYNSPNGYAFSIITDKYGCYNHHTGTMWVNCEHHDA
jgi:hypothetical protein